jgi:hypothetical protein
MSEPLAKRVWCEVCGRSVSERAASVHDGEGCLWCRGECDE